MSKNDDGFKQIRQISNWGYWERLGGSGNDFPGRSKDEGEEIIDGSVMIVRWPDKTETKETVHYEKGTMTYHDHGHEGTGPDEHSYIDTKIRGMKIQVPLRGLYCKIVSVPKRAAKK